MGGIQERFNAFNSSAYSAPSFYNQHAATTGPERPSSYFSLLKLEVFFKPVDTGMHSAVTVLRIAEDVICSRYDV